MNLQTITKDIQKAMHSMTTYHVGIVQNQAYRLLKQRTAKALAPAGITPSEWALLGYLSDIDGGVRPAHLAAEIGVEPPYISAMVRMLTEKEFIKMIPDDTDSRAKKICITKTGMAFVKKTESEIRTIMRPVVDGVSMRDLYTYYRVMQKIIANIEKQG
jgi:DNA-binding MarR family transcriptional regulator